MKLALINTYAEYALRHLFRTQPGNDAPQHRTVDVDKVLADWIGISPGQHILTWNNGEWYIGVPESEPRISQDELAAMRFNALE